MKKIILASILTISTFSCSFANNNKEVKLNAPNLNRKETMMQAFANRKSTKECSPKEIAIQDLSDLLWAANGINRPESGKRTAPSAMNKQDVTIYVCMQDGSYLFNPKTNILELISSEDVRPADAPIVLVLVTDTNDTWAALDAGIVSQNISIFCAGANMTDYPRASMDKKKLTEVLNLSREKTLMLCHPIGYFK